MASSRIQAGSGVQGMIKEGYTHLSGLEQAILKNIEACQDLGKLTRTSLGPNGMNKLIVNHLEKIFVTSDTATIMSEMEVVHPAAKMLVMAAKMQEEEFGDFTNFVITFASELLLQAKGLLRIGVHPSDVIIGFKRASEKASESLADFVCLDLEDIRNAKQLELACKASIASKFYDYQDLLADLVGQACSISITPPSKKPALNMDNIRVAKVLGGSIHDSTVIKGIIIRRPPQSKVRRAAKAKVAIFGTSVEAAQTETKGTVLIHNAEELLNYNKSEEALLDEQIRGIKESGIDVIVSGGSISDMALHFIDRYELMVVKVTSKFELRRICRTTGGTPLVRLGPVLPDEMGHCDLVETREIAGGQCVVFQQDNEESAVATILLRSSTTNQLDDLERAVTDGINTCKSMCEDNRCLPGGGACEIALANVISAMGDSTPGLEQYAIHKFAEALEVVPRTLAQNAGHDPTVVVSRLYAAHRAGNANAGVDIETGEAVDMKKKGIFDAYVAKLQAIRLACDAAITVLRVDQIIMAKQAGGPNLNAQMKRET
jgi:T-complex protein 1 subunit theta